MSDREFILLVQRLLGKYDGTPLLSRWQEAISFGASREAVDFWIRDTGGVTNVVWLNSDGIRDIALVQLPAVHEEIHEPDNEEEEIRIGQNEEAEGFLSYESMFNFLPLRSISTIEVREGPNIAIQMGLRVSGNKLVHVIPNTAGLGQLFWVADSPSENEDLDRFAKSVLSAYVISK